MTELIYSPRTHSPQDIRAALDAHVTDVRGRLDDLAKQQHEFDGDPVRITLQECHALLADRQIRAAAELIGRYGRKTGYHLHLVTSLPLRDITLLDSFGGSTLLRSLTTADNPAVTFEDVDGRTVHDLPQTWNTVI